MLLTEIIRAKTEPTNLWHIWILLIDCGILYPVLLSLCFTRLLKFLAGRSYILPLAKTVWEGFFEKDSADGCWIQVKLKDNTVIGGRFGHASTASFYPNSGYIYIDELWKINDAGEFTEPMIEPNKGKQGILLRPEDYNYIKVLILEKEGKYNELQFEPKKV
ncbi:MAG: DUF6338 family protein [Candidatus Symbiobacter sp.]|nr:DUF6338 family protein [Candidatus Symbiobacter sp.]